MRYHSTRGKNLLVSGDAALLRGAAGDGGLYVPESLPDLSNLMEENLSYQEAALKVFAAFLPEFNKQELKSLVTAAYGAQFDHEDITPLVKVGEDYILELFHGPTAAFKDVALQALPWFLRLAREKTSPDTTYLVLTATSGDTGSAAMRGFLDVPGFQVVVYYPEEGVSAVQRLQMTALSRHNVHAAGINGNFDDAQAAVKTAFQKAPEFLPQQVKLTSANSINIGRLLPQVVYYIMACKALKDKGALKDGQAVDFVVPSGNFGDILAGYLAKRMGLPIGKLVCASNENRVLTDFIKTGVYDSRRPLRKTYSPSMDILISSNLERLLYYAAREDTDKVRSLMAQLKEAGHYQADTDMMAFIRADFDAAAFTDEEALRAIAEVFNEHRYLMDPHTATAWLARKVIKDSCNPRVVLSTASPFKFPEAMQKALKLKAAGGVMEQLQALSEHARLPLPPSIKDILDSPQGKSMRVFKESIVEDVIRRAKAW